MNFDFLFNNFAKLTVTGLVLGSVYALIALGYTLVYGVLQLINFAHSEVFMYGTFAAAVHGHGVQQAVQPPRGRRSSCCSPLWSRPCSPRGRWRSSSRGWPTVRCSDADAPRLIALISAIGASFVLAELMGLRDRVASWFGLDDDLQKYVSGARINRSMPEVLDNKKLFPIGDYQVTSVDVLVIVSAIGMMVLLDQFVRRSQLGRGIRATAQDPETAALMGVNATRAVQVTFLLGGLMAGVAAFLYMLKIETTRFDVGFLLGVKAFTAAVLGGIGNLRGALVGGLVLGVAENWGSALFGTEWQRCGGLRAPGRHPAVPTHRYPG